MRYVSFFKTIKRRRQIGTAQNKRLKPCPEWVLLVRVQPPLLSNLLIFNELYCFGGQIVAHVHERIYGGFGLGDLRLQRNGDGFFGFKHFNLEKVEFLIKFAPQNQNDVHRRTNR
jgi:hypothetical protein